MPTRPPRCLGGLVYHCLNEGKSVIDFSVEEWGYISQQSEQNTKQLPLPKRQGQHAEGIALLTQKPLPGIEIRNQLASGWHRLCTWVGTAETGSGISFVQMVTGHLRHGIRNNLHRLGSSSGLSSARSLYATQQKQKALARCLCVPLHSRWNRLQ